jgi:hypothetical protein
VSWVVVIESKVASLEGRMDGCLSAHMATNKNESSLLLVLTCKTLVNFILEGREERP